MIFEYMGSSKFAYFFLIRFAIIAIESAILSFHICVKVAYAVQKSNRLFFMPFVPTAAASSYQLVAILVTLTKTLSHRLYTNNIKITTAEMPITVETQPNGDGYDGRIPILESHSPALIFKVYAQCSVTKARASTMALPHFTAKTPMFMPVGTMGTMKGLTTKSARGFGLLCYPGKHVSLGKPTWTGTVG